MRSTALLFLTFAVLVSATPAKAADRAGVDCDCDKTGTYVGPAKFAVPALADASSIVDQAYTSPGGNYQVLIGAQPLSPPPGTNVSITISKNGDPRVQLFATVTQAGWGFSPDDHRFAFHGKSLNGQYTVLLYDLEKPLGSNETNVYSGLVVDQALGFSPSGRYFVCATKGSLGYLTLKLVDVLEPETRLYAIAPTLGIQHAGWGFSPKNLSDDDPAFFWALQTDTGPIAALVNLQTMTDYPIALVDNTWWGFSPCGDLLATVFADTKEVFLYHTGSGQQIATASWTEQAQNLKPRCDAQKHYIGETPICDNTADKPCPDTGDTEPPTWPADANLVAEELGLDSVTLTWSAATDNVGVTRYRLYQDEQLIQTLESDTRSYTVTGLEPGTEYTFSVQAGDAADNWSTDGPSLVVTTTPDSPPHWPEDATLSVENLSETSLTLCWPSASDDQGVTGYKIYLRDYPEDVLLGQVGADTFTFDVNGLSPYQQYCFYVAAGDTAEQWSKGPSRCAQTLDLTPPYWPEPKSLSAVDVQTTSLQLTWSDAADNVEVVDYQLYVFKGGQWRLAKTTGKPTTVSCLSPYTEFRFKVEAVDPAGNVSTDGPMGLITTASGQVDCSALLERASVSSQQEQTVGHPNYQGDWAPCRSTYPGISADGRFVVFQSLAINLVPNDNNTYYIKIDEEGSVHSIVQTWSDDVFLRDRRFHTTQRCSVSSTGEEGGPLNRSAFYPAVSATGRFVAFLSSFSNLVDGDTNEKSDVFLHDTLHHTTRLVSCSADGTPGNDYAGELRAYCPPAISADGRYVAFLSQASNLVPDDTNHRADVFVKDMWTGRIERVNIASDGSQAGGESWGVDMTPDGRYVVFVSRASNLVPGDTNYKSDVFVHDRHTHTTERVSVSSDGLQANGDCCRRRLYGSIFENSPARISDDGRFVVFGSAASNLVPGDTNGKIDVFVHDRLTRTTRRVSIGSDGSQADGDCFHPDISGNGRFVVFASPAGSLVSQSASWYNNVFLRDTILQTTVIVSKCPCGDNDSTEHSDRPVINYDGSVIAFQSHAENLLLDFDDTNNDADIFVLDYPITPVADLQVSLSCLPDPVYRYARAIVVLHVENTGPDAASSISASFNCPNDLPITDAYASVGSVELLDNGLTYTLSTLPPKEAASVTIELTPAAGGTFTASAAVDSDTIEVDPNNNAITLGINVQEDPPTVNLDHRAAVNLIDFAALGKDWKNQDNPFADFTGDGRVDFADLAVLCQRWLELGSGL